MATSKTLRYCVTKSQTLLLIAVMAACISGQGLRNILPYELLEEQDPGTLSVNLKTDSGIINYFSPDVLSVLTFSFLRPDAPNQEYFQIDQNTGVLSNVMKIDREAICSRSLTCEINLDIKTQPHPYVQLLKVTVSILDINDNVPSFDDRQVSIPVSESSMVGADFVLPNAQDIDVGSYGIQGYRLQPNISNFKLNGNLNQDGSLDLHLVLASRLDREIQSQYNLKVLTWDGGLPQQTGTLTVDITVVDSNDNNPKFTNSTYNVFTTENIRIGTTVIQVQATDIDQGLNSEITYSFAKSTMNSYGSLFGIDRNTGSIFTKGEIDREVRDLYELSVVARDSGQNALSAYAKVKIHVRDENDNAPIIKVKPLSGAHANVPEDAIVGSIVALIAVTDTDSGQNGQFMCKMTSNQFDILYLYGDEYKIVTKIPFDREQTAEYHALLVCEDFGSPTKSTAKHIPIYVTDVNDHSPVFAQDQYTVEIFENNELVNYVTTIQASDADIGANAAVTYSIQYISNGPDDFLREQNLLTINQNTGEIRTNFKFDHENRTMYSFNVSATDDGRPKKLSSSTVLNLFILDVNDEPPRFNTTDDGYNFGTFENQKVGTEIGTVVATDRDSFPFANISYMFDVYNSNPSTFQIDAKSGKITTRKVLDRELKSKYEMTVIAYNPGTALQTTVKITVFVADKNDNAPFVDFPYLGNDTVNVMGNSEKGHKVTTVVAHDIDVGASAQLVYSIIYRNDNDLFDIDPILGEIHLQSDIDPSMYDKIFDLVIMVKDKGDPPLSSTTELYIFINGSFPAVGNRSGLVESNSAVAVVIICILVFIIVIIITTLFALFMMRRRRLNRQRQQRKYGNNGYQITAPVSSTKTLVELNTSGSSLQSDLATHKSSVCSSNTSSNNIRQNGSFSTAKHDDRSSSMVAENKPQNKPYHPVYLEKLPAHSSVLKYSKEVNDKNNTTTVNSGYNHLGEVQLQVHNFLHNVSGGSDRDLDTSSVTDSGKGSSEGDAINRSSPMEDLKKYSIAHNTSFPPSDSSQLSNYVFTVQQQQPNHHHHNIGDNTGGPLARSSGRSNHNNPTVFTPSTQHKDKYSKNPTVFTPQPLTDHNSKKYSPVLKGCMQNKNKLNSDGVDGTSQNQQQQPHKKKTVHFVKPYCSSEDQGGKSNMVTNNGNSSQCIDDNRNTNNQYRTDRHVPSDNNGRLRFVPGHSSVHRPYLIAQSRDSLASDYDGESQYSDGDTTTSGSYCMDDEEESVIGPDVLV